MKADSRAIWDAEPTDLGISLSLQASQGPRLAPGFVLPDGLFGICRLKIQDGNHFGEMIDPPFIAWLLPWAASQQSTASGHLLVNGFLEHIPCE